jgi:hypothetical protein
LADPTAPGSGGAGGRGPDLRGTGGTGLVGSGGAIAPGTGGSIGSGGSGPTGTGGRSTAGQNLIKNGDYGLGKTYWDLTWQAGQIASESYSGGEYCIRNESGSFYLSFSLGYPPTPSDAFPIEAGATYTLSYRARGFAALDLKIGQASPPYGLLVSFADTVASSVHQAQAHVFTPSTGDAAAGLVFNGTLYYYETVCFDDVVLVRN